MLMMSQKLKILIKLNEQPAYRLAQKAGLDPSTLSKLICGIIPVKPGDPRVIAVGRIVGISAEECFEN
jgi:hypothetical protein